MSRVKKTALALSVLFSLEFLSLGLFTNGTFSWTSQYVPPLLKAASHAHPRAAKLDSPAKPDSRFVLESSGEPIPSSGVFLTAKENVGNFPPKICRQSIFSQEHSGSQSVSLHFQIRSYSLIFSPLFGASFHSSDKKSSALIVLEFFLKERR